MKTDDRGQKTEDRRQRTRVLYLLKERGFKN
jgi:hypothetical protein